MSCGFFAVALASAIAIVDGDTITVGTERIRIANIDAPEVHHAQCDAELRLGRVAKARLGALLSTGEVAVIRGDPTTGRKIDRFGRTLARIEVDGRDVGAIMIAEGIVRPWQGKRRPWCS